MRLTGRSIFNRVAAGPVVANVVMESAGVFTVSLSGFVAGQVVEVAEQKGCGVKDYASLGAVFDDLAEMLQTSGGVYALNVDSGALMLAVVPLDVIKAQTALWNTLTKEITAVDALRANLNSLLLHLDDWDISGTAAQMEYMDELRARLETVTAARVDLVILKNRAAEIIDEIAVV